MVSDNLFLLVIVSDENSVNRTNYNTEQGDSFTTVSNNSQLSDDLNTNLTDNGPYQINTCHAMASDSEIVKERWPQLYTGLKNINSENVP